MTRHDIKNVLIHRLGSLGDTLVALPAFRLVRETFPGAKITVLTNHSHSDHAKSVGMSAILDGTRYELSLEYGSSQSSLGWHEYWGAEWEPVQRWTQHWIAELRRVANAT